MFDTITQEKQAAHAVQLQKRWDRGTLRTLKKVADPLGTSNAVSRLRTLFGDCTEPDILSIIQHNIYGVHNVLPAIPSTQTAVTFGYIVGYGTDEENYYEPTTPCADGPTGTWSTCELTLNAFGRIQRDSNTIELTAAMMRADACDTDFILRGSIDPQAWNLGDDFNANAQTVLNVEAEGEIANIGLRLQDQAMDNLWNGDPANNVGTGYLEAPGLDSQIDTGLVQDCPELDSHVQDVGGLDVSDPAVWDFTKAMERDLWVTGKRSKLMPTSILVMREELFWAWTEYLPCQMAVEGCRVTGTEGEHIIVDAQNENRVRQDMRDLQILYVNGRAYRVFFDDGIAVAAGAISDNSSTIYQLNLTILAGFPTTFIEHKNYAKVFNPLGTQMPEMREWMPVWSNNGQLLWRQQFDRSCLKIDGTVEFRPVVRCPQLCGKLTDVEYND